MGRGVLMVLDEGPQDWYSPGDAHTDVCISRTCMSEEHQKNVENFRLRDLLNVDMIENIYVFLMPQRINLFDE
ncbi:hypothetical protein KDK_37900 [Dictyobacter kobayashii]|uniref:Uncharacterized protein n=1 Tax=Dictyobacter kobayashii TaxID=2014872 RepID=A0A402ALW8_9CHLR|nr:hypothetical protein KDK_37900 [Dictyobacter kobayashii]